MQKLKNDRFRYGLFLLLELATIPTVIFLFRNITPKETAATIAACLFILIPTALLALEYSVHKFKNLFLWIGAGQFLFFFALPILCVRLMNPGAEFGTLSIFGVPAMIVHEHSSKSFSVMMLATAVYFGLTFRKKSQA